MAYASRADHVLCGISVDALVWSAFENVVQFSTLLALFDTAVMRPERSRV
jgi:hypothetical protein